MVQVWKRSISGDSLSCFRSALFVCINSDITFKCQIDPAFPGVMSTAVIDEISLSADGQGLQRVPGFMSTAFIDEFAISADGQSILRFQVIAVIFKNAIV